MRVLLSDGSGLTARQCAPLLARAGHEVGVLAPSPLVLARMTGAVRRWHRTPVFGTDPLAWAEAMLAVLDTGAYDVLLPTQEQVAVLSLLTEQVTRRGVATAVPPFAALRRVQDKLAAEDLLSELGLPRPAATIARTPQQLLAVSPPAYLKAPIGTAGTGVRHVTTGLSQGTDRHGRHRRPPRHHLRAATRRVPGPGSTVRVHPRRCPRSGTGARAAVDGPDRIRLRTPARRARQPP